MSRIAKEYMEHQRKYWMRHDAWRFLPPKELFEHKYNPDQPRVAAGNPDGGQWATEGGNAEAEADIAGFAAETLELSAMGRISPQKAADCEAQYLKDTNLCRLLGTRSCWEQASFRKMQCLNGGYVPPIYF